MSFTRIRALLRNLLAREHLERELDDEARSFLEMLVDEKVVKGMSPEEARRRSLVDMGGLESVKERVREARAGAFVEELLQDLRYGWRWLARTPGFTVVAVLTLALGLGANVAMFSVVDAVFLRPLPVPEPDRLVRIYGRDAEGGRFQIFSYPSYRDLRDRNEVFSGVAAHQRIAVSFSLGEEPHNVHGEIVSGNYFGVMGVPAAEGRLLLASDDQVPGSHPVMVVSHAFRRELFGSDPEIAGRVVHLNGFPFTVVGVAARSFRGAYETFPSDFWVPMMMHEQVRPRGLSLELRNWGWLQATARLKPGVTLEEAQANADLIGGQLAEEHEANASGGLGFALYPASRLPEPFREEVARRVGFFSLIVALFFLVACANVAGMLLVRVVGREHEIALRHALGARHGRLIRQWLTESALLSILAASAAVLLGRVVAGSLSILQPAGLENFRPQPGLDARLLVFTSFVALFAGISFGVLPALRAGRSALAGALRPSPAVPGGFRRSRLHAAFVVFQVAASLMILVAAGLLLKSLRAAESFDLGFQAKNLLLARVDLRRNHYSPAQTREFQGRSLEKLRALPGVESASMASVVPLGGAENQIFRIPGHEPPAGTSGFVIDFSAVGTRYFETMGIPLLAGRDFAAYEAESHDREPGAPRVAIVNQTMARRFWPGEDALGRFLGFEGSSVEIVGVASDITYYSLAEEPRPYVYLPLGDFQADAATVFHLRTATGADVDRVIASLGKALAEIDPKVALISVQSFEEARALALFPQRALASLTAGFGVLALALTAVGLYGLLAYVVGRRRHEIGIRMALGAARADLFRLVLGQGLFLVGVGLGFGAAGALAASRLLEGQLFGVAPRDPAMLAAVSAVLTLIALFACYWPARQAMRVDPSAALRQ